MPHAARVLLLPQRCFQSAVNRTHALDRRRVTRVRVCAAYGRVCVRVLCSTPQYSWLLVHRMTFNPFPESIRMLAVLD